MVVVAWSVSRVATVGVTDGGGGGVVAVGGHLGGE